MLVKRIVVTSERCVGCEVCEAVCSVRFEALVNPIKARIKVARVEDRAIDLPVVCLQCSDTPCGKVCPAGAIGKSEAGVLQISRERCTGCGLCVEACPIGAASMDRDAGAAIACDLCGMDPMCVKYCPTKAIDFVDVEVRKYEKLGPSLADVKGLSDGEKRRHLALTVGKPGKFPDPYDSPGYKSARKVVEQAYSPKP